MAKKPAIKPEIMPSITKNIYVIAACLFAAAVLSGALGGLLGAKILNSAPKIYTISMTEIMQKEEKLIAKDKSATQAKVDINKFVLELKTALAPYNAKGVIFRSQAVLKHSKVAKDITAKVEKEVGLAS